MNESKIIVLASSKQQEYTDRVASLQNLSIWLLNGLDQWQSLYVTGVTQAENPFSFWWVHCSAENPLGHLSFH